MGGKRDKRRGGNEGRGLINEKEFTEVEEGVIYRWKRGT